MYHVLVDLKTTVSEQQLQSIVTDVSNITTIINTISSHKAISIVTTDAFSMRVFHKYDDVISASYGKSC